MSDNYTRQTFEALPFYATAGRLWRFFKRPAIVGDTVEDSDLVYSGRDTLDSILLVLGYMAFLQSFAPGVIKINVLATLNPVYLQMTLGAQAIVFGLVLSAVVSFLLILKIRAFHRLILHQTLRSYAILNFFIATLMVIGVNRLFVTGSITRGVTATEYWVGGFLGLVSLVFAFWLLVWPLYGYIKRHYSWKAAAFLTLLAVIGAFYGTKLITPNFTSFIIDKPTLCRELYMYKLEAGQLPPNMTFEAFLTSCFMMK